MKRWENQQTVYLVEWRKLERYGALEGVNRKGGGCQLDAYNGDFGVGTGVVLCE